MPNPPKSQAKRQRQKGPKNKEERKEEPTRQVFYQKKDSVIPTPQFPLKAAVQGGGESTQDAANKELYDCFDCFD